MLGKPGVKGIVGVVGHVLLQKYDPRWGCLWFLKLSSGEMALNPIGCLQVTSMTRCTYQNTRTDLGVSEDGFSPAGF